jgi:hypothetical protein
VSQVPAVSDLDRAGPSRAPSAQAPAGQHVDGSPGGSVDQDRGVDVAAAQREVIDADHVRRRTCCRIGQAEGQPQQRAAMHRDTQRSGQPRPGLRASSSATWGSNPASVLRVLFG